MKKGQNKNQKRLRLKNKIRTRVHGTAQVPRLSVFRSNVYMYAQLINDETGTTIAQASDLKVTTGTKSDRAALVGSAIAEAAKKNGVTTVVFDRNGFKYTGRIARLADAARAAGLIF